jgi:hypothetical protein
MNAAKGNQVAIALLVVLGVSVTCCGGFVWMALFPPRNDAWRANEGAKPFIPKTAEEVARENAEAEELRKPRETFVARLAERGLVRKSTWSGTTLQLWVTPAFMRIDLAEKELICRAAFVFAKRENERLARVELVDVATGKRVGDYRPGSGVTID